MHFEGMAETYSEARPPYPQVVYDVLRSADVIGPGKRVLEIGAGSGLATRDIVAAGSLVTAIEPGPRLAQLLQAAIPAATVLRTRLEDVDLPGRRFDSVVAATAMHWVDLEVCLPKLHDALRERGWLAVWRTVFGNDAVSTPFRERVGQIVAERGAEQGNADRREDRPTMAELSAGGYFVPVDSYRWPWSVKLNTEQVRNLFSTFSDWAAAEVDAAAQAADACGGKVTEHYVAVMHLLRRASLPSVSP